MSLRATDRASLIRGVPAPDIARPDFHRPVRDADRGRAASKLRTALRTTTDDRWSCCAVASLSSLPRSSAVQDGRRLQMEKVLVRSAARGAPGGWRSRWSRVALAPVLVLATAAGMLVGAAPAQASPAEPTRADSSKSRRITVSLSVKSNGGVSINDTRPCGSIYL